MAKDEIPNSESDAEIMSSPRRTQAHPAALPSTIPAPPAVAPASGVARASEIPDSDNAEMYGQESSPRHTPAPSAAHALSDSDAPQLALPEAATMEIDEDEGSGMRPWIQSKIDIKNPQKLKDLKKAMWTDNRSMRSLGSTAEGTVELAQYDRVIQEMLAPEIESDNHLSNLALFKKAKDQLRLSRQGSLPPPALGMTAIHEFLAQPPVDGRSFRYSYARPAKCDNCKQPADCTHQDPYVDGGIPITGNGYNIRILDNATHPDPWLTTGDYESLAAARRNSIASMFINDETVDGEDVRRIALVMCRLAERWPVLDEITAQASNVSRTLGRYAFKDLAFHHGMPEHSRRLFTFSMYKTTDAYSLRVRYLTGSGTIHKQDVVPIAISPSDVDLDTVPPPLAKNLEGFFKEQIERHVGKTNKTGEEKLRHTRAIHVALYIASQLHDQYFDSSTAVKMRVQAYFNSLVPSRKVTYGPLQGAAFFQRRVPGYSSARPQTRLLWREKVVNLLPVSDTAAPTPLPEVCIFSRYYARIAPVTDTAINSYLSGNGLHEAVESSYEAADIVNTEIDQQQPLTDTCSCDEDGSTCTIHSCTFRGCQTLCIHLKYSEVTQSRICPPCTAYLAHQQTRVSRSAIKHMAAVLVTADFEAMNAADHGAVGAVVEGLLHDLETTLEERDGCVSAPDHYVAGAVRTIGSDGKLEMSADEFENSKPFRLSIDAIFQTALDAAHRLRLHVPGNVALIAEWLNFAKHTWTPAWLQILARLSECSDEEERKQLLRLEDDIFTVHLKTPYMKAARFGKTTTPAAFKLVQYERVSGKPVSTSALIDKRKKSIISWGGNPAAPRQRWVPGTEGEFQDRILPLIQEIIQEYKQRNGRKPAYGKDGCPFPGDATDMPPDWSWWTAWVFIASRLQRMWLWCNGKWMLVDVCETLYIEILIQWLRGGRSFFNLTWVLWVRHARRVVFAHRVHGAQMRSGCKTTKPRTLEDYDEQLSNIDIETAFENYARHNYNESAYTRMKEEFARIAIPLSLYNPDILPPMVEEEEEAGGWSEYCATGAMVRNEEMGEEEEAGNVD